MPLLPQGVDMPYEADSGTNQFRNSDTPVYTYLYIQIYTYTLIYINIFS